MYKNLVLIVFIALSLVTIPSCSSDDDVIEPEVKKTLLEIHQENLKSINVEGDELSYLDYGESNDKVIILLHGSPTSSFLYRNIVPELANETDFRVIALDLLGFGKSAKPDRAGAYTPENQAARVYAFADALGIDTFVLGVHDIGGAVGWRMFVSSQKERISGLLVTDTSLKPGGFTPPALVQPLFAGLVTPRELFESVFADETSAKMNAEISLRDGMFNENLITDQLIDAYAYSMTQPESHIEVFESFVAGLEAAIIPMVLDSFSQFDKPVAVLWGGEDIILNANIITAQFQEDLNVPDEYVKILDNTGHYLQEDAPEEYVNFVSSFLNTEF